MGQSRQIGKGQEASEIKPGDVVRLLQPFRPERYCLRKYAFGIVVGVIRDDSIRSDHQTWGWQQTAEGYQCGWHGLVIHLYEPDSSTIYVDQFGVKALFSFDFPEVELYQAIETPSTDENSIANFSA